jgi:outer membrane protein assembly factor BamD (BamD/ComL family)
MTKTKSAAAARNETAKPEVPTKEAIAAAIENADKLAESQLEIAKMFLSYGKAKIARRRLQMVIEQFAQSRFAGESRQLLSSMHG